MGDQVRGAVIVAVCVVYGALFGALVYKRWAEVQARLAALERRQLALEYPPENHHAGAESPEVLGVVVGRRRSRAKAQEPVAPGREEEKE